MKIKYKRTRTHEQIICISYSHKIQLPLSSLTRSNRPKRTETEFVIFRFVAIFFFCFFFFFFILILSISVLFFSFILLDAITATTTTDQNTEVTTANVISTKQFVDEHVHEHKQSSRTTTISYSQRLITSLSKPMAFESHSIISPSTPSSIALPLIASTSASALALSSSSSSATIQSDYIASKSNLQNDLYIGPYLDDTDITNVTVQIGTSAYLPCKVCNVLMLPIIYKISLFFFLIFFLLLRPKMVSLFF